MNRSSQFFLLRELVRRDFSQRYAGFAWSIIQPLWQLILLSIVFSMIIRLPLDGENTGRFWVFLFCGLLPWTAMHEGILRGGSQRLQASQTGFFRRDLSGATC